ncbi:MAG: hypothetical protein LBP77_03710 [Rickettsiales bacterium]|nr:hypothetical protein [Rickettsiales bacterium]
MLEGSVFDGKKTRSQCLGTGMTPITLSFQYVMLESRSQCFLFVIPVRDTGIQGHIDRCRQFVIPLRVSGI